jgi:pimeloyl-ACP methyl ester carboxylesterase/membrane protein DedA with SNARE-associated domain
LTIGRSWRRGGLAFGLYSGLLLASFIVRDHHRPIVHVDPLEHTAEVGAVDGDHVTSARVHIAYWDFAPASGRHADTIVLLHGSPGRKDDFRRLGPLLARDARVLAPDLPGFGSSTRTVPDYSFLAHALYVRQLLDALGVARAHVLGFSMGGGVALSLVDVAAGRVSSLTMLSAIGVQEMELTGDYYVNHLVHGAQLVALWGTFEGTPHMGLFDGAMLGIPYARNFFDSDQRPLRRILNRISVPTLIVHGTDDTLVPIEAAREHGRLVPQSDLVTFDGDHFLLFANMAEVAEAVGDFVRTVEDGRGRVRAAADPKRTRAAAVPFEAIRLPRVRGIAAAVFTGVVMVASLVAENVTSVAAGVLVARGRISLTVALVGCFAGMFLANVLLFLAGRLVGLPTLQTAPSTWFIRPEPLERSVSSLSARGVSALFRDSFLLGGRRTRSVAAGLVTIGGWRIVGSLFLIAAIRTVLFVGAAAAVSRVLLRFMRLPSLPSYFGFAAMVAFAMGVVKVGLRAVTARGRRLLVSTWRRGTRWEFWPPWIFYPPVVAYVACLMVKHRSATLFTASNPAILAGGFIGESKYEILRGLAGAGEYVARASLVAGDLSAAAKLVAVRRFMVDQRLGFPIVLKPNNGQRGSGVVVVRSAEVLEDCLRRSSVDTVVQEYVAGAEFGLFYCRRPSDARGHIFSVTEKRFPSVVGDGRRTLEQLILDDERAVCAARLYCDRHRETLWRVPGEGEVVALVELGTHSRGAMFLDGSWVLSPALEARVDAIARGFDGFYFGRFDVRVDGGLEAFHAGQGFKIIELNGVTSEATHIYHPGTPLLTAYRVLMRQWRTAFEIGAENLRRGVAPTGVRSLFTLTREYRRTSRRHLRDHREKPAAAETERRARRSGASLT